jgi:hypothetical protein
MEQSTNYKRYKTIFLVLTAVVFIWGIIGALDITRIPYAGYNNSPDRMVTLVREGSPAAQAGLRVGDTITHIDGIPLDDTAALSARGRPAINSDGSLTVTRGGTEQTLTFKYSSQPAVSMIAGTGATTLTGLAFLILGLMAYLRNPTRLSTGFSALSLLFAALLFNGPYIASSAQRRIVDSITTIMLTILFAAILDYCLNFPRAKNVITARPWLRQAIYVINGAFGVALATITITTPPMNARRTGILVLAFSVIFGGSILLSVIAVIHSYFKASSEERAATGLNIMLAGILIGFAPLLLSIIARLVNPHLGELPGEQFYGITLIALPIGMAMALMKLEPAGAKVVERATA